jgi:hypothetical protein
MVRFGQTLAETRLPEWRAHYIDYDGLKQKLQQVWGGDLMPHSRLALPAGQRSLTHSFLSPMQARDSSDSFPEAEQHIGTSFSIPRSVSQPPAALLQQQQQDEQEHAGSPHQHLQDRLLQQHQQQTAPLRRPSSGSGVPQALLLDNGPAEQFLQLLQQELHKVC